MKEFIEITDFHDPELDVFARLTEAQLLNRFEPKKGMFIAESPMVIERALDAGCEPVSFPMARKHIDGKGAALLARCPDVPVYAAELGTSPWAAELSEETLRKMFNFIHIDWNSGER